MIYDWILPVSEIEMRVVVNVGGSNFVWAKSDLLWYAILSLPLDHCGQFLYQSTQNCCI